MFKYSHKFFIKCFAILISFMVLFSNISWVKVHTPNPIVVLHDGINAKSGSNQALAFDNYVNQIYTNCNLQASGLALPVFQKSVIGYFNLANHKILNNQKNIVTIIDFTKESTFKRLWIIDLKNQKLLLNSLVAHGQGSGDNIPNQFSNIAESHQSSLGFYVTDEIYFGKHGLSLKLEGLDAGVNSLAKFRSIVVHGANYVSESFIKTHGRLGRSHGCPAVPEELNSQIIDLIKDKTMLYINGTNQSVSNYLDENITYNNVFASKKFI